ncbi:hypothetical protein F4678DRAFT_414023 [Xylaria arbuscula]|nr:hypothetical protein F4678DRAFT_414023 [Xylaria arbuscula]
MSFLRARIYDEDWSEMKNYTIHWKGRDVKFPTIFRVPAPFEMGGGFYGPEDPRIIIEEGVDDAEPVIVHNMLSDIKRAARTMHILRPFTNSSILLNITEQHDPPLSEKNWAPFYYNPNPSTQRLPSQYLHFIYDFKPLQIIKCHLGRGHCKFVYKQSVSEEQYAKYKDARGRMNGGTNLISIPLNNTAGKMAYVGFPRTHMDAGCLMGASYRPELMVMVAVSGSSFYIDYLSQWTDFGSAVLPPQVQIDPCGDGRIMMASSIARWDTDNGQDVMTLFLSLADAMVQVLRVHGVLAYVDGLMRLKRWQNDWARRGSRDEQRSKVGYDILGCSVEVVQNYTVAVAKAVHGKELGVLTEPWGNV